MRRIWNYLREVRWWLVAAFAALVVAVVFAIVAVSTPTLGILAIVVALFGVGLALIVKD